MSEEEQVETNFKAVSKMAQSLVKDSHQTQINEMLGQLKVIKERLVKVRKQLPQALQPLKSTLPHIESLETGISDLNKWLTDGETLLQSHKIDGNINVVEDRLDKHKVGCGI